MATIEILSVKEMTRGKNDRNETAATCAIVHNKDRK